MASCSASAPIPAQTPADAIGNLRMFSRTTGWAQRIDDAADEVGDLRDGRVEFDGGAGGDEVDGGGFHARGAGEDFFDPGGAGGAGHAGDGQIDAEGVRA